MRLNGINSLSMTNSLSKINKIQTTNSKKLTTGQRINSASDDAAGLSLHSRVASQISSLDSVKKNIMDGISLVQVAEGSLNEVHRILSNVRALAIQAENGIYTNNDKSLSVALAKEMKLEIEDIVNKSSFNGISLLQGETINITSGINKDDSIEIQTPNLTHLVRHLIVKGNPDSITDVSKIDSMIDSVSNARAQLGAVQNRLQHSYNNVVTNHENLSASDSRIIDSDFAQELATKSKSDLLGSAVSSLIKKDMRASSILNLLS